MKNIRGGSLSVWGRSFPRPPSRLNPSSGLVLTGILWLCVMACPLCVVCDVVSWGTLRQLLNLMEVLTLSFALFPNLSLLLPYALKFSRD